MPPEPGRRLAAILSADVAGYSRLIADDEAATIRTLSAWRELVQALLVQHGGQLVDFTGDNFLAEFPAVLDAVTCALEIQQSIDARNAALPEARRLRFRIGAHLGDVRHEDGRLYGDGVNIAARLQALAEPGGLCLSAAVVDQVRGKLALETEDLGAVALKNLPQRVRAFRARIAESARPPRGGAHPAARPRIRWISAAALLLAGTAWWLVARGPEGSRARAHLEAMMPSGAEPTIPDLAARPAIAVLPFENLSEDPEQAFFAEGLAEDLITRLSSFRSFPVIARSSSFQYRGAAADVKRVGRELGARYLVAGSVRRAGDRIRVSAQLIDAESAQQLWADGFDGSAGDVFARQDEFSTSIAASLTGDLQKAEATRARQGDPRDLAAWGLYQMGIAKIDAGSREDLAAARELFERAIARDPEFGAAQGWLAHTILMAEVMGDGRFSDALMARVDGLARRALELDPRDAAATAARAFVHQMMGDRQLALVEAQRAVALNPSLAHAWVQLAYSQWQSGDLEGCLASAERVRRLDPRGTGTHTRWVDDSLELAYWELGRYEEGLAAARRLSEFRPGYYWAPLMIAANAEGLGRRDEARAAVATARRVQPNLTIELALRSLTPRAEVGPRLERSLRAAGLE